MAAWQSFRQTQEDLLRRANNTLSRPSSVDSTRPRASTAPTTLGMTTTTITASSNASSNAVPLVLNPNTIPLLGNLLRDQLPSLSGSNPVSSSSRSNPASFVSNPVRVSSNPVASSSNLLLPTASTSKQASTSKSFPFKPLDKPGNLGGGNYLFFLHYSHVRNPNVRNPNYAEIRTKPCSV